MGHGNLGTTLEFIRRLGAGELLRGADDGTLLARFIRDREEAAFAALVHRHGSMVYRVCWNLLHSSQDADDAFQAAFLVLARKAGSLDRTQSLCNWLFGVAYRVSLKARAVRLRQARRELQGVNMGALGTSNLRDDSAPILLAEIERLPARYRAPIALCYLEEKSRREAARQLGWPEGTVATRLRRGRDLLRKRLLRHGLVCYATGVGLALSEKIAPAAASSTLVANTIQSALAVVTPGAAAGLISANAARLANDLAPVTWLTPIRFVGFLLMVATVCAGGFLGLGSIRHGENPNAIKDSDSYANAFGAFSLQKTPNDLAAMEDPLPPEAIARLDADGIRIGNSAFTLTPDEKWIVTLSPEGIFRKLDARTGKLIEKKQISDRTKSLPVFQPVAQISKDGRVGTLDQFTSNEESRATVWDLDSGKLMFRCPIQAASYAGYRLSPDGKKLAVAEKPKGRDLTYNLRVYDLASGRDQLLGKVEYNLYEMVFTQDGRRLYVSQTDTKRYDPPSTGGNDRRGHTYACFDLEAGKEIWKLERGGETFAISPDGNTLVGATFDSRFQIIHTAAGSHKATESFKTPDEFQAHPNVEARIAADNRTLILNQFNKIILWDIQEGKSIRSFPISSQRGAGFGMRMGPLSADASSLWINEGSLQCWNLQTGKARLAVPPAELLGPINQVVFNQDGSELHASSWSLVSARWDVASGKQLWFGSTRQGTRLVSTPGGIVDLIADSPNGSPGGGKSDISLLDPVSGKVIKKVTWAKPEEGSNNALRAYSISKIGKKLLIVHGDAPPKNSGITTVDIDSGRTLAHFQAPGHVAYPNSPFSPCGRLIILQGKLYQVEAGVELFAPRTGTQEHLAIGGHMQQPFWFSPDARLLAGRLEADDKKAGTPIDALGVWEIASGKLLARIPNTPFVVQVVIAPDNGSIALADGWGVRIHDLLTGKQIAAYPASDIACGKGANEVGVSNDTLVYSPDGRKLATGHQDGSILLWKAPERTTIAKNSLSQTEAESLWADLANDTPATARTAIEKFLRSPTLALAVLDANFKSTTAAAPAGDKPVPYLPLQGEYLRGVRAIEVLERIGTPAAKTQLDRWAKQKANPRLAEEARFCLQRLIGW